MKVTTVDLYHVEIPPIQAIARHTARIYDITLCAMRTDEGLTGIGERAVYVTTAADRDTLRNLADAYVGRDP